MIGIYYTIYLFIYFLNIILPPSSSSLLLFLLNIIIIIRGGSIQSLLSLSSGAFVHWCISIGRHHRLACCHRSSLSLLASVVIVVLSSPPRPSSLHIVFIVFISIYQYTKSLLWLQRLFSFISSGFKLYYYFIGIINYTVQYYMIIASISLLLIFYIRTIVFYAAWIA